MIKNNFNTLMAERLLKITRVANDTGISRTTLTALSQEMNKGVQMDTLNTLCNYFNITPCEFFDYIPYEFAVKVIDVENDEEEIFSDDVNSINLKKYELFINVLNNKGETKHTFSLNCELAAKVYYQSYIDDENSVNVIPDEDRIIAVFTIKNETDDKDTFLTFLLDNFSAKWRFYILDYIENIILFYGKQKFYEFSIENNLKSLI